MKYPSLIAAATLAIAAAHVYAADMDVAVGPDDNGTTVSQAAPAAGQAAVAKDGTRRSNADPFSDVARIVAGRDLTGVSASPARVPDSGAEAAPGTQAGPSAESVHTLSGWDRTGPSAPPAHSIDDRLATGEGQWPAKG